jgi:hypothetical protein
MSGRGGRDRCSLPASSWATGNDSIPTFRSLASSYSSSLATATNCCVSARSCYRFPRRFDSPAARPEIHHLSPDNEVYGFWQVVDDSWLHDLLYGRERRIVIRYDLVNAKRPTVATTADDVSVRARFPNPTWRDQEPSKSLVDRLFAQPDFTDSSIPFSASELPLESVTQPTAKDPSICRGGS